MRPAILEFGIGAMPLAGERVSGDRHVIQGFPGGVLMSVIDAVGHGAQAARAAELAVEILERDPAAPAATLLRRCHERLRETRGAAMAIARLERRDGSLSWLAVGNVCGVLLRARAGGAPRTDRLLVRGGMIGDQLPELEPLRLSVAPGDTLIVTTDGIEPRFIGVIPPALAPQALADRILREYARGTDDALVLVARHNGDAR